MEYIDSQHNIVKDDALVSQAAVTTNEIETQPNSLVTEQLAAQHERHVARQAKVIKTHWWRKSFGGDGLSGAERIFFLDNLSTMLRAGLALAPSLSTLSEEMK